MSRCTMRKYNLKVHYELFFEIPKLRTILTDEEVIVNEAYEPT